MYEIGSTTELWFDSSPLTLGSWLDGLRKRIDDGFLSMTDGEFESIFSDDDPSGSCIKGVVTNPPITMLAVNHDPSRWSEWVRTQKRENRGLDHAQLASLLYKQVLREGAMRCMGLFEKSGYKLGYVAGQVDPRNPDDVTAMVRQGIELHNVGPNVTVKMPGTREGIFGIELLTSLGIPTTATLTFTVAQLIAAAEAVRRGLLTARRNRVDLTRWRSTVTMMLGRLEDSPEVTRQCANAGFTLTGEEIRWMGLAIFKKAHAIYKERKYESRLLAASMRMGPVVDGAQRIWHMEKLLGCEAVLAVFPNVLQNFIEIYNIEKVSAAIDEPVPSRILDKLLMLPYFRQAYEEDGQKSDEFALFPPAVETLAEFQGAMVKLESFAETAIKQMSA